MNKEAEKEIRRLLQLAEKEPDNPVYGRTIREIYKKFRKRMPRTISRKFCKKCNIMLTPKNSFVRVSKNTLYVHCKNCGELKRVKIRGKS